MEHTRPENECVQKTEFAKELLMPNKLNSTEGISGTSMSLKHITSAGVSSFRETIKPKLIITSPTTEDSSSLLGQVML